MLGGLALGPAKDPVVDVLARLYGVYRQPDAELIEINPLAVLDDGRVVALDCKLVLDDAAAFRQAELREAGAPEQLTDLEQRGAAHGLQVHRARRRLSAFSPTAPGLTMTTMERIAISAAARQFPGDRRRGLYARPTSRSGWCSPTRASKASW